MDLKQIKTLLEKYYNGESTLEEEQILYEYFIGDDVSSELEADKDIFLYNLDERNKFQNMPDISGEIWNNIKKSDVHHISREKKMIYWAYRVAASLLVLLASYFFIKNQFDKNQNGEYQIADTYENPEEAYEATKQALLYVSEMMNSGTDHLEPIQKINESTQKLKPISTFNDGLKELNQIKKYQIANKYIKE